MLCDASLVVDDVVGVVDDTGVGIVELLLVVLV